MCGGGLMVRHPLINLKLVGLMVRHPLINLKLVGSKSSKTPGYVLQQW